MITLGIILIVVGAILNLQLVVGLGILLLVVGVIFFILGSMGRAVGGRRHYY